MIYDLKDCSSGQSICRTCDICIVGAGTAGLFLAQSLQDTGIRVIVIELGGTSGLDAELSFEKPKFSNHVYQGALKGRVSGLGGTSSKWGGQMIGLSECDFNCHEGVADEIFWPITKESLRPYYKKVASVLGFNNPSFSFKETKTFRLFKRSLTSNLFRIRVSTWIPFRKRNFAAAFRDVINKSANIQIWVNTKLSSVYKAMWDDDKLVQLTFIGPNGQTLVVTSDHFAFTMGAIETTKYVSKLIGVTDTDRLSGKPFCDHISSSVGRLDLKDRDAFLKAFSPFFVKNIMKTIRFEFLYESQVENETASAFVHFVSQQKESSALDIIRSLARKLQGEPVKITLRNINFGLFLKDIISILVWRLFRGKLVLNLGGEVEVLVDIEQRPEPSNRIFVREDDLDLSWGVTEKDRHTISTVAQAFSDTWNNSQELSNMGRIRLEKDQNHINYYDVYHPTGSLPFGKCPDTSFLDPDLRVWSTSNVYVSSTAVFPTGGSANPGFTHLALTQRLSDHLQLKFSKRSVSDNR